MEYGSDADAAYITFRDAPWDHMDILDDYRNIVTTHPTVNWSASNCCM